MFPTDSEFTGMYFFYLIMLIFLVYGFLSSKNRAFYKWNLLIFGIYFAFMIYVFLDSDNFKYGNSLVILFYGTVFVLSHFVIIGLIKLYKRLIKK